MLKKIGKGSFWKSGIERVVIPKGVEEIEESAFWRCEGLTEVVFGDGSQLKKIGGCAFCGCTRQKNIQFPDGLETIGIGCFRNSGIEDVVLPASVKEVGAGAF